MLHGMVGEVGEAGYVVCKRFRGQTTEINTYGTVPAGGIIPASYAVQPGNHALPTLTHFLSSVHRATASNARSRLSFLL